MIEVVNQNESQEQTNENHQGSAVPAKLMRTVTHPLRARRMLFRNMGCAPSPKICYFCRKQSLLHPWQSYCDSKRPDASRQNTSISTSKCNLKQIPSIRNATTRILQKQTSLLMPSYEEWHFYAPKMPRQTSFHGASCQRSTLTNCRCNARSPLNPATSLSTPSCLCKPEPVKQNMQDYPQASTTVMSLGLNVKNSHFT